MSHLFTKQYKPLLPSGNEIPPKDDGVHHVDLSQSHHHFLETEIPKHAELTTGESEMQYTRMLKDENIVLGEMS